MGILKGHQRKKKGKEEQGELKDITGDDAKARTGTRRARCRGELMSCLSCCMEGMCRTLKNILYTLETEFSLPKLISTDGKATSINFLPTGWRLNGKRILYFHRNY